MLAPFGTRTRGRRWADDPDLRATHQRAMVEASQHLFALRTRHGWSQDATAKAAGIDAGTLLQLEKADGDPQLSTHVRAFYALGYEVYIGLRPRPVISG